MDGISPVSHFSSFKKESVFSSKYLVSYYSSCSSAFLLKNPITFRKCCKTMSAELWLVCDYWLTLRSMELNSKIGTSLSSAAFRSFSGERINLHPAFLPNLVIQLTLPFLENLAFLFCNEASSVLTGIVSGVGLRCRNMEVYLYYLNLLVLDVRKSYFRFFGSCYTLFKCKLELAFP